ncbi:UNVERIFIED_CONTAM: hypothetical protein PYX00_006880 [Menopon gallinae]|uniref:CRAL-TRIO domain-containing protein n=1 Tax=Menopon gallinae TaxID=328185 RepID=A0AAW2HY24_9NEOP
MATVVESHRGLERFPVDVDLSEEFLKRNDNGSKETPENRAEKVQEMLVLLNDHPELNARTDDVYLLRFLRAKYFNTKAAFNLLKNYEEFRSKYHEQWMNVDLPTLRTLTTKGAVQVLPGRDQHARRVFWLRGGLWKPGDCSIDCLLQAGGLCGDATIVEPMTQIAGIVMIFDLKDVGMSQIKGLSTTFAKKMVHFLANCLPVRINAIHVVNEPALFSMILSLFKAFLTEKMKKGLYFHGSNLASLHEHVSPTCLPPELGGTYGEVDPREWLKVFTGDMVLKELKALGYNFVGEDK